MHDVITKLCKDIQRIKTMQINLKNIRMPDISQFRDIVIPDIKDKETMIK